jgi:glyoxylase I family protein
VGIDAERTVRLPDCAILGVGHTGITVSDLGKSVRFYREILGFDVSEPVRATGTIVERITGVRGAALDVAFVRAPGHFIELLSFVQPAQRSHSRLEPCDPGFFHLCFKVRKIERVLERVRTGGFEPIGDIQTLESGPAAGMHIVYVRDPDGVCLEFVEEPPGVRFEELFLGTEA